VIPPGPIPPSAVVPPVLPRRVIDDLDLLLEMLPDGVRLALASPASREDLLEIVLDLGRSPQARYSGRTVQLEARLIERADLASVVQRLGPFGGDNRAGIERTLHRISAIRNRVGEVVGLTCRVAGPCSAPWRWSVTCSIPASRCCCWARLALAKPRRCARSPGCWRTTWSVGSW